MRTSTTCGPSSAPRATGSRRSAASATDSTMPDGAATFGGTDPADQRAQATDARLVRDVRWRLVLWSGLTTLVVLAVLGIALYVSAARTLEDNGVQQVTARTNAIMGALQDPGSRPAGPEYGFIFGGSGTFAMAVDATGRSLGRGPGLPSGLPVRDALGAAVAAQDGKDLRVASLATVDQDARPTAVPIRVLTERVSTPVGDAYIQVVQARTAEQQTLDRIRN